MSRRELLHPDIVYMREVEGLKWREIGERLGLAQQTVHDYYSDPDNSKHIARHRRWQAKDNIAGSCPKCGSPMAARSLRRGGAQTCWTCHTARLAEQHEARLALVAEMFNAGKSYRAIAEALGYGSNSQPPEISMARQRGLIGYRNQGYGSAA